MQLKDVGCRVAQKRCVSFLFFHLYSYSQISLSPKARPTRLLIFACHPFRPPPPLSPCPPPTLISLANIFAHLRHLGTLVDPLIHLGRNALDWRRSTSPTDEVVASLKDMSSVTDELRIISSFVAHWYPGPVISPRCIVCHRRLDTLGYLGFLAVVIILQHHVCRDFNLSSAISSEQWDQGYVFGLPPSRVYAHLCQRCRSDI